MKKRVMFLYFMIFSMPILLGLVAWQSVRYQNLQREVRRLEQVQSEWVETNKRQIAVIAEYSSPERIEFLARNQLELQKIRPEHKMQVRIAEGSNFGN